MQSFSVHQETRRTIKPVFLFVHASNPQFSDLLRTCSVVHLHYAIQDSFWLQQIETFGSFSGFLRFHDFPIAFWFLYQSDPEEMAVKCQKLSSQPREWLKGKVVGSGSFGTVHLAMDPATGGLFVVKSAETDVGFQSLENEADILENLDSRHVVKCTGKDVCIRVNGTKRFELFIEYMAGGSLADVSEKFGGALDERVIRLYTREILHGLKYLHENSIVHCDLKCRNVLLGSDGNIKLADFGCAKRLDNDLNQSGISTSLCNNRKFIGGTPLWMAPEVLRNEGIDFSADIWSLGCLIIEMATGKPPWGHEISNPMAAVLKIACSDVIPDFPSHFSQEGLDFLAKCLQRDAKRRWTANELLEHPFVTGKTENIASRKEDASCSPSSVLDLGMESEDSDSDESSDGDLHFCKTPFSMRCFSDKKVLKLKEKHRTKSNLMVTLEDWVTVRTK